MWKQHQLYEKGYIIFSILIIFIYLSPLIIFGENAHIRIHDNLDSNIAWYKVLSRSGEIFGSIDATIPQVINGLPRNALGTEFSGIVWLHHLFPTMVAYILSQGITRYFAFLGMYLLLKKHFLKEKQYFYIVIGVALSFALTPFWPSGMLSTLGMPLALWAFLNIRNGEKDIKNYVVLTLLPFYSSFVLGFFFFLFAMGVLWLFDGIRGRGWNLSFFIAILYMLTIYLFVEYRLVASFILDSEPNSRDEYFHARLSFLRSLRLTFKNFIFGHTHVMSVHGFVILPLNMISLFIVLWKKKWKEEKTFISLMIINFLLSLWYAFWFYKGWFPLTKRFHILDTFNFARFHFLRPMIIYICFALSLKIVIQYWRNLRVFTFCIIIAQIIVLFSFNDEIIYRNKPTVKEFYAVELFNEIKNYISQPVEDYRVVSIGLHPAIAQYNGFYTLDTYNNFYPLAYKYQFRKIIEKELEKNKRIRQYFDEWGGRCYIFTSELGKKYMYKKTSKVRLKNLQLNIQPFKELGGKYIFSSVPIDNYEENQLKFHRIFSHEEAAWNIYLYEAL